MSLDLLVGHVQHDVTQEAALPHPVHGQEGVVVVPLGVVGDAVAVAVHQLHASPRHGGSALGTHCCLPGPLAGGLEHTRRHTGTDIHTQGQIQTGQTERQRETDRQVQTHRTNNMQLDILSSTCMRKVVHKITIHEYMRLNIQNTLIWFYKADRHPQSPKSPRHVTALMSWLADWATG